MLFGKGIENTHWRKSGVFNKWCRSRWQNPTSEESKAKYMIKNYKTTG